VNSSLAQNPWEAWNREAIALRANGDRPAKGKLPAAGKACPFAYRNPFWILSKLAFSVNSVHQASLGEPRDKLGTGGREIWAFFAFGMALKKKQGLSPAFDA